MIALIQIFSSNEFRNKKILMIKHNPYRNIFMYYRGPSVNQMHVETQLEDNITKSLINLFEYADKDLLKDFMKGIDLTISADNVIFDLQAANSDSRPDALIRTNECDIYIESKYGAPFDAVQLEKHIKNKNINDNILYISKQKYTEKNIQSYCDYCDDKVIFLTWFQIAVFILKKQDRNTYPKNTVTNFLINQYIEYMKELNMTPFLGWSNRDFEAFLVTENENQKVANDQRKRVKEKLEQFLNESKEHIDQKYDFYKDCSLYIGNLDKEHVWGAIKFSDESLINQIHISVIFNAYNLSIGIQIEGKNPTTKAIKTIKENQETFLEILRKLDHFKYVIRRRYQIQVSKWDSDAVGEIALGSEITSDDLEFIVKKMEQYKYVELRIARIYDKHEVINKGQRFIDDCVDSLVIAYEIIQFLK